MRVLSEYKFPRQFATFIQEVGESPALERWLLSISVSERKEGKAMDKKILVPLAQNDRTEEIIPYVENVARPGMKVVFLMRYPVDGFIWGKEEYGMRAAVEAKQLINHYSWEENLRRAAERISYAAEVLGCKGVDVAVDVYAGSLKKALRSHTLNGDVHLIMTRAGIGEWIARLFDGTGSAFDWFRRPRFFPVLLTRFGRFTDPIIHR